MMSKIKGKGGWIQTNADKPCPICGQHGHCGVAANGSAAICHNVSSDRKLRTGGYLHKLRVITAEDLPPEKRYSKASGRPKRRPPEGPFDETHFTSLPTGEKQRAFCAMLGEKLGVAGRALESLDVRWDERQMAAAFPMRSADGRHFTGVTYRYVKTGDKFNAKGGVDGLYLPLDLDVYDGRLIVCEGASDTAALLSNGARNVIGRPGCRASEALIAAFCRERHIGSVIIVADRDEPTDDVPEGVGLAGARHLAEVLKMSASSESHPISVSIRQPASGYKDLREWLRTNRHTGGDPSSSAGTREEIEQV